MSQSSTAGDLAEEAACSKGLEPDCYALHIVLGNSEAERTLHPTERVLTVMQTVQCDFFFCLKRNVFAERVKPYVCIYVCTCMCVCVCIHVCVYVCTCVCLCVHVCAPVLCVCTYACLCLYVCVYMYVCVCMYVCVYTCTCTHT